jgi:hypothetical protein
MNTAKGIRMTALIAVASVFALTASAQSTNTAPQSTSTTQAPSSATTPDNDQTHTLPQVKQKQADRIASGVRSGNLTAGETSHLETDENRLDNEKAAMKAQDNGNLTAADKAKLQNQYHNLSQQIYTDKHNSDKATYNQNTAAGQARQNQQDRIAEGIQNGSLTNSEASKLEQQQHNANAKVDAQRDANGGNLTQAEKQADARRQAQMSRNIRQAKHNNKGQ